MERKYKVLLIVFLLGVFTFELYQYAIYKKYNFNIFTNKIELAKGFNQLIVIDSKFNENSKFYNFSSSDESVVMVDNDGVINAIGDGNAIVSVKSIKNNQVKNVKVLVYSNDKFETLEIIDNTLYVKEKNTY